MDEQAPHKHSTHQPGDDSLAPAEEHRAFVREMNNAFSSVYGYGGAAVMAIAGSVLLVGWNLGQLTTPLIWLIAVSTFLVGLFVLRIFVRRRAKSLRERIRQYCDINDLSVDELRERWADDEAYPYFEAIFEVVERRENANK